MDQIRSSIVEPLEDAFTWRLHGFAELKSVAGQSVASPIFVVSKWQFCLKLYQNGKKPAVETKAGVRHDGCMGLFLDRISGPAVELSATVAAAGTKRTLDRRMYADGQAWGWHTFVQRSEAVAHAAANLGALDFRVAVTIFDTDVRTGPDWLKTALDARVRLWTDLGTLLDDPDSRQALFASVSWCQGCTHVCVVLLVLRLTAM